MSFIFLFLFFGFFNFSANAQGSFSSAQNSAGVTRACKEGETPCIALPPGERACNSQANETPCIAGQFVPMGRVSCGFDEGPCIAVQQGQKICRNDEKPCIAIPPSLEEIHRCISKGFENVRIRIYQCYAQNHKAHRACLSKVYEVSQRQQVDSFPANPQGDPECQPNDARCIYLQCTQRKSVMREACMKEAYRSEQTILITCARSSNISIDCAHPRGMCTGFSQTPILQGGPNSP